MLLPEPEFKEGLGTAVCMQWLVLGFPIHTVIRQKKRR